MDNSQETASTDFWYDYVNTTVSTTTVATVTNAVFWWPGGWWQPMGGANSSYVPVDFEYNSISGTPVFTDVGTSSPYFYTANRMKELGIPLPATVDMVTGYNQSQLATAVPTVDVAFRPFDKLPRDRECVPWPPLWNKGNGPYATQ